MRKTSWLTVALDVASTIALVVAVGTLAWRVSRQAEPEARPTTTSVSQHIGASLLTNVQGSGPVAIVEFTDFECSFCGRYARNTLPAVKRDLIDSAGVRYVVLNFPLEGIHPTSRKAGEAAECAARQGKYWPMHERLFADGAVLDPAALTAHAAALALDLSRFTSCMDGEATAKISADIAEGRRLGVSGTPAFFIGVVRDDGSIDLNTRINGIIDIQALRKAVEASIRLSRLS
jgi:protein-disulfide isomerase